LKTYPVTDITFFKILSHLLGYKWGGYRNSDFIYLLLLRDTTKLNQTIHPM
jgi:hypothetical protein